MPVAAAMVLLVHMIAILLIAFIKMHTHSRSMATVQPAEYIFTVRSTTLYAWVVKNMLQPVVIDSYWGRLLIYDCAAHGCVVVMLSKGDTMPARLLCCRCR